MDAIVILNPRAARGRAKREWPSYARQLSRHGIAYQLRETERPGDAVKIAAAAASEGYSPIVAAGGDGTLGEVVNGIASVRDPARGRIGPVGLLPLGTSNDLAKVLSIPLDPEGAAETIAAGRLDAIDIGIVNGRYFVLNSAATHEAQTSLAQSRIPLIASPERYMLGGLWTFLLFRRWEGRLAWPGGGYRGPLMMLTVGNACRTGGFYMSPHADPRDGLLTFVYAPPRKRADYLQAMAMAKNKAGEGSYVELPGIFEVHAPWLEAELSPASPLHADGEILSTRASSLRYSILPQALNVLA